MRTEHCLFWGEPELLGGGGVPLVRRRAFNRQTDVAEGQLAYGLLEVTLLTQSLVFAKGRVDVDRPVPAVVHGAQQTVRRLRRHWRCALGVHDDGAVMRPFPRREVLPHHRAARDAAACRPAAANADAGAATVAAALRARVQRRGHPLLVGECERTVHFRLGGEGS